MFKVQAEITVTTVFTSSASHCATHGVCENCDESSKQEMIVFFRPLNVFWACLLMNSEVKKRQMLVAMKAHTPEYHAAAINLFRYSVTIIFNPVYLFLFLLR